MAVGAIEINDIAAIPTTILSSSFKRRHESCFSICSAEAKISPKKNDQTKILSSINR